MSEETVMFTKEAVKKYLDDCIVFWRKKRNSNAGEEAAMCEHYIDAYQSVRTSLFGETFGLSSDQPVVDNVSRYGYIRSTHDKHNNYKFDDVTEKLKHCDWDAGAFTPFDFVPGIVHMLDDDPVRLEDLVKRVNFYNNQYPDAPFDIMDIPRNLLMGIEIGAISVMPIDDKLRKA